MNEPKLKTATDAEWRTYYEEKCREQRKEIESIRPGFDDLVSNASATLPEGWQIVISIEKDSTTLELIDPDGIQIFMSVGPEKLSDGVEELVKVARGEI